MFILYTENKQSLNLQPIEGSRSTLYSCRDRVGTSCRGPIHGARSSSPASVRLIAPAPYGRPGGAMMHIEQFFLEGLGHQSYFVTDSKSGFAAVVDPRRDVDIYLRAAERASTSITHIL